MRKDTAIYLTYGEENVQRASKKSQTKKKAVDTSSTPHGS